MPDSDSELKTIINQVDKKISGSGIAFALMSTGRQ
jgi:hypothetical protein